MASPTVNEVLLLLVRDPWAGPPVGGVHSTGLLAFGARALAGSTHVARRDYRVQAIILFCGLPVFSKIGVGSGYAVAEESTRGEFTEVAL